MPTSILTTEGEDEDNEDEREGTLVRTKIVMRWQQQWQRRTKREKRVGGGYVLEPEEEDNGPSGPSLSEQDKDGRPSDPSLTEQ